MAATRWVAAALVAAVLAISSAAAWSNTTTSTAARHHRPRHPPRSRGGWTASPPPSSPPAPPPPSTCHCPPPPSCRRQELVPGQGSDAGVPAAAAAPPSTSPPPPPPPPSGTIGASTTNCLLELAGMFSCGPYLTRAITSSTPTRESDCCRGVSAFFNSSSTTGIDDRTLQCVCPVIHGEFNRKLLQPIDHVRLLYLPIACGVTLPAKILWVCWNPETGGGHGEPDHHP